MKTSENVDKILPALMKVKKELKAVTKDASNPFFKSKYADLNTYLTEVEPLLDSHGLMLVQPPTFDGLTHANTVVNRIYHAESGQFIEGSLRLVGESDMQKLGSAVTYARRYILGGLLSMQAIDDDGEGSMARKSSSKTTTVSVEADFNKAKETANANLPTVASAGPRRPSFRKNLSPIDKKVEAGDDI
jgi:hypothetical protein